MKYYLKTPHRSEFIDLESTTETEATLAALPICSTDMQKVLGYPVYKWRVEIPSKFLQLESFLYKTDEEDRFNIENKVISKWV